MTSITSGALAAAHDDLVTESFTVAELDMLRDAVFQRAGDARTEREEGHWLDLVQKVLLMKRAAESAPCQCEHSRGHHGLARSSRCRICQCPTFEPAARRLTEGERQ